MHFPNFFYTLWISSTLLTVLQYTF
jgi:hypothetical protein